MLQVLGTEVLDQAPVPIQTRIYRIVLHDMVYVKCLFRDHNKNLCKFALIYFVAYINKSVDMNHGDNISLNFKSFFKLNLLLLQEPLK